MFLILHSLLLSLIYLTAQFTEENAKPAAAQCADWSDVIYCGLGGHTDSSFWPAPSEGTLSLGLAGFGDLKPEVCFSQ